MARAILLHPRMTMLAGRNWESAFGLPLQFSQLPVLPDHPAIAALFTMLLLPGNDFPRREWQSLT